MLPSTSPQKRRRSEYRDPDYPAGDLEQRTNDSTSNKRICQTLFSPQKEFSTPIATEDVRLQRLCEIINREFEIEINNKQQQLELLEERLSQAQLLLHRLRYAIVAEYYQKQEAPLSRAEVAAVRGNQTVYTLEQAGPQMPLHPSLKKIIGKRPCNYAEILRTCPQRAAAQNAKIIIKNKTAQQRREERRKKKLIREQGIVIDHSKPAMDVKDEILTTLADNNKQTDFNMSQLQTPIASKALNAARLNNKIRHLIVVGNTSKYMGGDINKNPGQDQKPTLSHKWLVYIQCKDKDVLLESFVKKVRFFLHPSYRPNDVVDVFQPPFQLARRGWGEFPIRMQLFFLDYLQQKPVQLIHNIVLDKTLSGMHTLGAETVVEIWLRTTGQSQPTGTNQNSQTKVKTEVSSQKTTIKEELDEKLLEFLNKIGETPHSISADIEKIEPTVIVSDDVCKIELKSPKKDQNAKNTTKTSNTLMNQINTKAEIDAPTAQTQTTTNKVILPCFEEKSTTAQINNAKLKHTPVNTLHITAPFLNTNNVKNKMETKTLLYANERLTNNAVSSNSSSTSLVSNVPRKLLQKKLVRLVDATGKVRVMHMFVATTAPNAVAPTLPNTVAPTVPNTVAPVQAAAAVCIGTASKTLTTSTTSVSSTTTSVIPKNNAIENNTSLLAKLNPIADIKNANHKEQKIALPLLPKIPIANSEPTKKVVFQKEGKIYIIDPLQIKLKQQQKQQVSLLKPQVSLLKNAQNKRNISNNSNNKNSTNPNGVLHTINCDHDYVSALPPSPTPTTVATGTTKMTAPSSTQSLKKSLTKQVHLNLQERRLNVSSQRELLLLYRTQFQQRFLSVKFANTRIAVDYLLRRLPLAINGVTTASCSAHAFPFVYATLQEFQALTAIKQRASEWLRAKCMSRLLSQHKQLQELHASKADTCWSTKEILAYARWHAYTPPLKVLPQFKQEATTCRPAEKQFSALIKSEVQQEEHELEPCETLCPLPEKLSQWVALQSEQLQAQQDLEEQQELIDIVSEPADEPLRQKSTHTTTRTAAILPLTFAMPTLPQLASATDLVDNICKDLYFQLEKEEYLSTHATHPLAKTLLAQCLQTFVEKLLRQSIAIKMQQQPIHGIRGLEQNSTIMLSVRDLAKTIYQSHEFDFLTNRNLGVFLNEEDIASSESEDE